MESNFLNQLDNPAWQALTSRHAHFAIGEPQAKRYRPDIVSFVAFASAKDEYAASLDKWINLGESFFIIGDQPPLPAGWELQHELVCSQMVCTSPIRPADDRPSIHVLGAGDSDEMYALISQVQPGYYLPDTRMMGNYAGIRQEGKLVAMAGERMQLNGLTELSAICTLPGFTGRHYAQHLITHLVNRNIAEGHIPFLHVSQTNQRAIGLYERLGFVHRRFISFCLVKKTGNETV